MGPETYIAGAARLERMARDLRQPRRELEQLMRQLRGDGRPGYQFDDLIEANRLLREAQGLMTQMAEEMRR